MTGADGEGNDSLFGPMLIPWIASGPRLKRRQVIDAAISTTDTAATAAHLLGIHLPDDAPGRPVLDAFVVEATSLVP